MPPTFSLEHKKLICGYYKNGLFLNEPVKKYKHAKISILKILHNKGGNTSKWSSPTLDRFYPEKEYIKGNICVISKLANTVKQSDGSKEIECLYYWYFRENLKRKNIVLELKC